MFKGPIEGPFGLRGKATSGELSTSQVIAQTFTADPLARTWFIGTITRLDILGLFAFHIFLLSILKIFALFPWTCRCAAAQRQVGVLAVKKTFLQWTLLGFQI